jgi:hypothetical protein
MLLPLALAVIAAIDPAPAVTGNCSPSRVHFTGHLTSDGPAKVTYTWVRVNQPTGRTMTLEFPKAGTLPVSYDLLLRKSEEGWVMLRVILPQQADSAKATFRVSCK